MSLELRDFIIQVVKKLDSGDLPTYPDPGPAPDLGTPLTQAQIDQLKNVIYQINVLFSPP